MYVCMYVCIYIYIYIMLVIVSASSPPVFFWAERRSETRRRCSQFTKYKQFYAIYYAANLLNLQFTMQPIY